MQLQLTWEDQSVDCFLQDNYGSYNPFGVPEFFYRVQQTQLY